MTKCDVCRKDVKITMSLTLIPCPALCEECFSYIIDDKSNREKYIDEGLKE